MYIIFNIWLRYSNRTPRLILKQEKQFTLSFIDRLSNTIRTYMPVEVKRQLIEYQDNEAFIYLFCANLYRLINEGFEQIIEKHFGAHSTLFFGYYLFENEVIEENEVYQQMMKVLNVELLHEVLQPKKYVDIYVWSLKEAMKQLQTKRETDFLLT